MGKGNPHSFSISLLNLIPLGLGVEKQAKGLSSLAKVLPAWSLSFSLSAFFSDCIDGLVDRPDLLKQNCAL